MNIYIAAAYTHSGSNHSYYVFLTEPEWDTETAAWEPTGDFVNVCGKGLKKALGLKSLPNLNPPELYEIHLNTHHTTTWFPP